MLTGNERAAAHESKGGNADCEHCEPFTEGGVTEKIWLVALWSAELKTLYLILRDSWRQNSLTFSSLACDKSTAASDIAQLLTGLRGSDDEMNVTEELLDPQNLNQRNRFIWVRVKKALTLFFCPGP